MQVSVVIAAYNCKKYIERALRSVLDQDFPKENYEILVVDDGSKDGTSKILKLFDRRIRVITFKKNRGLSYARNYAIKNALGKFVVCIDADDFIARHLLTIEHLYLECNSNIDAVSCDYIIVNDKEELVRRCDATKDPIACGIMFYKDKLNEVGLYDEDFLALEDLDLRKRYLEKFNIYNVPLPLYRYRHHETNMTKKKERMKFFENKLYKKHKVRDMAAHLENHKNLNVGLNKCHV